MGFQKALTGDLLDHIFGKTVYTPPATLYIGLSKSTGSSSIDEVVGGDYERQPMVAADWALADRTGNAFTVNTATITFPSATADWGLIKEAVLWDTLTGGNALGRADSAVDKTISTGDVVIIMPDKLKFILI